MQMYSFESHGVKMHNVLFTRCLNECSKFLNSNSVRKKSCSVVSSTKQFELEQHPEGDPIKNQLLRGALEQ